MNGLHCRTKVPEHEAMKPSSIRFIFLVSALFSPWLQAQDPSAEVREIEQRVLLKQYQNGIDSLVASAREAEVADTSAHPELIGKRLQWLTLVATQIEGENKTPAADQEQLLESAGTLNRLARKMVTSPDTGARHPEIALKLADIALELAAGNKDLKPKFLDTKARALFLLDRHAEAITEQEKAIAAAAIPEEKTGLEATLDAYRMGELPATSPPAMEGQYASPYGAGPPTDGTLYIAGKLKNIIIPSIDFEDTTLEEAVDYLRKLAVEFDSKELDPARKGVNLVIRRPTASTTPASETPAGEATPNVIAEPGAVRITGLHLRNVPLALVLKYICDATGFRYKVDDFAVTLVHQSLLDSELLTRGFRVPPGFLSSLDSGSGENRPSAIERLKAAGIQFGEGSSVRSYSSGVLIVTNIAPELDRIEMLIATMVVAADTSEAPDPTAPVPAIAAPAKPGE
jgi:hypothetical protein